MAEPPPGRSFMPVRALQRGLQILQALSRIKDASAAQIARNIGLPRPTVIRLLETLHGMGFIERSASDGSWRLTHHCLTLTDGYNEAAWVRECAVPVIEELGREILWPVDLMVFQGYRMIVRESTHRISPFSVAGGIVGTSLPLLETAGGRAWLAFCSEAERAQILDFLEQNQTPGFDPAIVSGMIEQTQRQGYGMRVRELYNETSSFSVPIHARGRLQAVLTVVFFSSAFPVAEAYRRFGPKARDCAERISRYLETAPESAMDP